MTEPFSTIGDKISEFLLESEGPLDTPCWLWQRSRGHHGHGQVWFDGKLHLVHRLVWIICIGDVPDDLCVLHKCDDGRCCNPEHLFLGTQQDNIADMINKGRDNFVQAGEKNGKALIKADDIPVIRQLCAEGYSHTALARKFGVQPSAIDKIATRRTWRHIP